jgi:maltose alpha-D-glucosyltransferase / alpha-amylase
MKVLSLNWSKARGIKMTKVDINDQELWYKDAIFYEVYVRAFRDSNGNGHGDLKGLTSKLDYLQDLGVNCLWLLPIYPSPLNDDGYDIADFYNIHSDYGTLDDFIELVDETHSRGMRIITDLVLNHTSDQHPWFQAARSDRKSPYRDYYVWSDSDDKYKEARIIFVDTEKSNWSWDEQAGQYYWHRFFSSQPDLKLRQSSCAGGDDTGNEILAGPGGGWIQG